MTLAITNAVLVTPEAMQAGSILIGENGRIEAILPPHDHGGADTRIDAHERLLFPGFVDAHVHFRDPGLTYREDFSTGSTAAAIGGVTTVMCMPNTSPPIADLASFRAAVDAGTGRSFVDFTLQATIPPDLDTNMGALWHAGISSFETSLADGQEGVGTDRVDNHARLLAVAERIAELDAVLGILAGDQDITDALVKRLRADRRKDIGATAAARPPIVEALGLQVILEIVRATGARTVFRQVNTARGHELLKVAKAELPVGQIAIEVTPHNCALTDEVFAQAGLWAQIIPPIRSEHHRRACAEALADGSADILGSDHAPHAVHEKEVEDAFEARNGSPGLDTIAAVALDLGAHGTISYPRIAEFLAAAPARIFGIGDRKGRLAPGFDGDLVLVDPREQRLVDHTMIHSKPGRSVFEGLSLRGWPVMTVLRGRVIAETGERIGEPRGQFLLRTDASKDFSH